MTALQRYARDGMEPVVVLLVIVVLRQFDVAGDTPLWIIAAILLAGAVHQQPDVQRLLSRGDPERLLWLRIAVHLLRTTAIMYLIGWGPLLAVAHLHIVSMYLRQSGSRAWRAGAVASVVSIALGELAFSAGLFSYLPQPEVHGVAALVAVGTVTTIRVLGQTVAQQERAELALRRSEERFRALVQDGADVITVSEANGVLTYVSDSVREVAGYEPDHLVGVMMRTFVHPADLEVTADLQMRLLTGAPGERHTAELRIRNAAGEWRWHEMVVRNMLDNPAVGGIVTHHRDVTERRNVQDRLAYAAAHDALTGLVNSATLHRDLDLAVAQGTRYQHAVAMLFLDLDGFKQVNDSYGHEVGDHLLRTISKIIGAGTRDTDIVGRLGGDEFGVVLTRVGGPAEALSVATRIVEGIDRDLSVAGHDLRVGCSIGVSFGEPGALDARSMLRQADFAMYRAKRRQRNGVELYVDLPVGGAAGDSTDHSAMRASAR